MGQVAGRQRRQGRVQGLDHAALGRLGAQLGAVGLGLGAIGLFLGAVGFGLGQGGVAEHEHGAGHVAQLVAAVGVDGDFIVAARELRHGGGQSRDRAGDRAAEDARGHHRNGDQGDAADDQGRDRRDDGGLLTRAVLGDVLDLGVADLAQRQHCGADQHLLARVTDFLLRGVALAGLNHLDQAIAPLLAPGEGRHARVFDVLEHLGIGERRGQLRRDLIVLIPALVVRLQVRAVAGDEIAAELAVLAQNGRLERQRVRVDLLAVIAAFRRGADHQDRRQEDDHHDGCGNADEDERQAELLGNVHGGRHRSNTHWRVLSAAAALIRPLGEIAYATDLAPRGRPPDL